MGHAYGSRLEDFRGAYLIGSTVGLADDAELPTGSDVDVMVVGAAAPPGGRLPPFRREALGSPQVRRRPAQDRGRAAEHRPLGALARPGTSWLFATGVTTHVLLVAALRNPTVRLRYLAARRVLAECGHLNVFPGLLGLLGCAGWDRELAGRHLEALADTFDTAAAVARTPFFFSSDITPAARPIAIDAGRELIRAGQHCEAVFWMVATFARCHMILAADAPAGIRRPR